jgi:hypothetical protein
MISLRVQRIEKSLVLCEKAGEFPVLLPIASQFAKLPYQTLKRQKLFLSTIVFLFILKLPS